MKPIEPFGFFKAEPFGWTDCAETDEGAQPLYDQAAIRLIQKERDELLTALEIIATAHHFNATALRPFQVCEIANKAIASVKGGAA